MKAELEAYDKGFPCCRKPFPYPIEGCSYSIAERRQPNVRTDAR
jgi:hypothetical protein